MKNRRYFRTVATSLEEVTLAVDPLGLVLKREACTFVNPAFRTFFFSFFEDFSRSYAWEGRRG